MGAVLYDFSLRDYFGRVMYMDFDVQLFRWLFSFAHQSAWLDTLIIFLGEFLPYLIVLLFVWFLLRFRHVRARVAIGIQALITVLLARGIVVEVIRFFYPSARPWSALLLEPLLLHETSSSFPSGHATFFVSLAGVVFLYHRKWGMIFMAAALVNAAARVAAGVHWPSDILGGILVAMVCVVVVHRVVGGFIAPLFPGQNS